MPKTLTKFDAAATLRDSDAIAEYMAAAFETQDPGYVSHALGVVARARGMSEIARESGLSREHLYRSFSENGNPTLKSILAVMGTLGVQLSATAIENSSTPGTDSSTKKSETRKKAKSGAKPKRKASPSKKRAA